MIRPEDFEIRFDTTPAGTTVSIWHLPTGNSRSRLATHSKRVGAVRDSLLEELQGLLFRPEDIVIHVGLSTGGDFISVTHIPTGIQRMAMRRKRSKDDLLEEVLTELFSDPTRLRQVQERDQKIDQWPS